MNSLMELVPTASNFSRGAFLQRLFEICYLTTVQLRC